MTSLLCDASAMVALILADDTNHDRCHDAVKGFPVSAMVSTWPCLTEAMYLLGREGDVDAQELLWDYLEHQALALHVIDEIERPRLRYLMRKYADAPMDLADASLVSAAASNSESPEYLRWTVIFTPIEFTIALLST